MDEISDRYSALLAEVREAAKAFKTPEDWFEARLAKSGDF